MAQREGLEGHGWEAFVRPPAAPRPTPSSPRRKLAAVLNLVPASPHSSPTVEVIELGSEHLVSLPDVPDDEVRISRMIAEELRRAHTSTARSDVAPALPWIRRTSVVAVLAFGLVWNVVIGGYLVLRKTAPVAAPEPPRAAAPPTKAPALPAGCTVGAPRVLARGAQVRGGVESSSVDQRLGLAVVTGAKEGSAFELEPSSLAVKSSTKVIASEPIRRLVPALEPEAPLDALVDDGPLHAVTDGSGDTYDLGVRDGYLVWAPRDGRPEARLWAVGGDVDAPRVARLATPHARAIVFRRGGEIHYGTFRIDGAAAPLGALGRLSDVGALQVGAPSIAARGDDVVATWAQRDTRAGEWGVKWAHFRAFDPPRAPHALALPPGGPGVRAIAPTVAASHAGFLLAWTEGGAAHHQVRALLLGDDDKPRGAPIAVSPPGSDAGQEQIALRDGGQGAIGYLVSRGRAFDLVAAPVTCSDGATKR